MNRDDEAPVEAHSCPAGHAVRPGARRCPTCGTEVGIPHPSGNRASPGAWVLVGVLCLALVLALVLALGLALR